MSHIDCIDHEFVGWFGNRPIYHPLEVYPDDPDCPRDFGCTPENLVIGGGSGEWPGVVVSQLDQVAELALVRLVTNLLKTEPLEDFGELGPAMKQWLSERKKLRAEHFLHFAGWSCQEVATFVEEARSLRFNVPLEERKYNSPEHLIHLHDSLEDWLAVSIGEFVLFSMPDLIPQVCTKWGNFVTGILPVSRHVIYENVRLTPPGYPVWGGRRNDPTMNIPLQWGFSAWEIKRVHYPITIRQRINGEK